MHLRLLRSDSSQRQFSGTLSVCLLVALCVSVFPRVAAAQNGTAEITRPRPFEVIQRDGFVPNRSHIHAIGGPQLGSAQVEIQAEFPAVAGERFQYRLVKLHSREEKVAPWQPVEMKRDDKQQVSAAVQIPAGGWYRLELRQLEAENQRNLASMEPFGVGEVFLIAGQSYAAGHNDELQRVEDPLERVVAYDAVKRAWQVAHDPQPNVGDGGTIWPPMGDSLLIFWEVPIGLVNVAVAATSSRQWMPGTELYEKIAEAGTEIGNFRAVLWQQGESDVIEKVTTDTYVKNLTTIRSSLAKKWEFEPQWLLAKSTLHPQVYNNPAGEAEIRAAIAQLWTQPGFRPGPDTDILAGENRGGPGSRRHFSRLGQRRAAQLWFAAVWHEFHTAPSIPEQTVEDVEVK